MAQETRGIDIVTENARGAANIRVVIADDHPLMRSGIRGTLSMAPDVTVVAEAEDAARAVELCEEHSADVLLLDLSMPGPPPRATLDRLRAASKETNVIVVTAYDDPSTLRGLLEAGAAGYILKDEAPEALLSAVRAVDEGGTWISRVIAKKLRKMEPEQDAFDVLTPRERDVLELIARGKDNVQIAQELDLARQTVRNYVSQIYSKLDAESRVELAVRAREMGFGSPSPYKRTGG